MTAGPAESGAGALEQLRCSATAPAPCCTARCSAPGCSRMPWTDRDEKEWRHCMDATSHHGRASKGSGPAAHPPH